MIIKNLLDMSLIFQCIRLSIQFPYLTDACSPFAGSLVLHGLPFSMVMGIFYACTSKLSSVSESSSAIASYFSFFRLSN